MTHSPVDFVVKHFAHWNVEAKTDGEAEADPIGIGDAPIIGATLVAFEPSKYFFDAKGVAQLSPDIEEPGPGVAGLGIPCRAMEN